MAHAEKLPTAGGRCAAEIWPQRSWSRPCHPARQPFRCQQRSARRSLGVVRAEEDPSSSGNGSASRSLNEETLRRLEQAEAEAAELRKQLLEARQIQEARGQRVGSEPKPRGPRIDGADLKRENLFDLGKRGGSWVQERDLEFFKGATDGPLEVGKALTTEEKATVQRRLVLGLGLAAVAGGLSLVPLDVLTPAPTKPLFFYLTPLIRVQALLQETGDIVQNAQWDDLRYILRRIEGPPNDLKENLYSAAAALTDGVAREKAKALAADVVEYVAQIDFDKYFDAQGRGGTSQGGKRNQEFVDFSASSVKATQTKLAAFLRLFPAEDVQAARDRAATPALS